MRASCLLLLLSLVCVSWMGMAWSKPVGEIGRVRRLNRLPNLKVHSPGINVECFTSAKAKVAFYGRGGEVPLAPFSASTPPSAFYNMVLLSLTGGVGLWKWFEQLNTANNTAAEKPHHVRSLQYRFLSVFWLLRMADWLQGPYFFEVYNSKVFKGIPASVDLVSKIFLTGFAVTGVFGPAIGRLVDKVGRKKGTIALAALYTLSALSAQSNELWALLLGRVAGGLGTSLLFSAPEAWLVGEHGRSQSDGRWLSETFGWAYAGDSVVAILAGQLAGLAAKQAGPTGPFVLSVFFLLAGAALAMATWGENTAQATNIVGNSAVDPKSDMTNALPIGDALQVLLQDKRILLIGAMQALFEGAMYIFVLQWPPLMKAAVQSSHWGPAALVPYGNIFSCLMASCLVGSTAFNALQKRSIAVEKSAPVMLTAAAVALAAVTQLQSRLAHSGTPVSGVGSLLSISATMFLFEACVGMYFPTIGTLRSKYLPDRYRSVLMNLFGLPLNLIVISVVLSVKWLGAQGALTAATTAVAAAAACAIALSRTSNDSFSQ